MKVFFLSP